ncbi:MAG: hypothetical protein U9R19_17510, partial [Bacteroidota bacterium]|nr:hypothetical protein [Bacteroidota bacterium]
MIKPKNIIFNGKQFLVDEFLEFIYGQLKNKGLEKYLIDLYSFYSDWFGHNETISVQSSGSTGPPKTIVFNKRQLVKSARQTG